MSGGIFVEFGGGVCKYDGRLLVQCGLVPCCLATVFE